MSSRLAVPIEIQTKQHTICACCGRTLIERYMYLFHRPERFCEQCWATRPHCGSCGIPVNEHGWKLHDGRWQCVRCHTTAIYDPHKAHALYTATVQALAQHPGLVLRVGVTFRLVDQPTLQGYGHFTATDATPRLLGLYRWERRTRIIFVLYGLPLVTFREVVAHEFAHAWQKEHCPLLSDEAWIEGFAEWVAYRHLLSLGASKAAERLRLPQSPYAALLERCLHLEQQHGVDGVLERIRRLE